MTESEEVQYFNNRVSDNEFGPQKRASRGIFNIFTPQFPHNFPHNCVVGHKRKMTTQNDNNSPPHICGGLSPPKKDDFLNHPFSYNIQLPPLSEVLPLIYPFSFKDFINLSIVAFEYPVFSDKDALVIFPFLLIKSSTIFSFGEGFTSSFASSFASSFSSSFTSSSYKKIVVLKISPSSNSGSFPE